MFLVFLFYIFRSFRVIDKAGYRSAFYCTLNTHYRIVSYRIKKAVCFILFLFIDEHLNKT